MIWLIIVCGDRARMSRHPLRKLPYQWPCGVEEHSQLGRMAATQHRHHVGTCSRVRGDDKSSTVPCEACGLSWDVDGLLLRCGRSGRGHPSNGVLDGVSRQRRAEPRASLEGHPRPRLTP
eukprot:COSAG01_NODE_25471_length_744_cov_0.990698_1_plen_119_part_01